MPRRFRAWRDSWLKHHPGWEYRLWTDEDNRRFIHDHYAWFLPIYDGYDEHIMRVDAVRYFILDHHGGVYVDLDFECLRPLDAHLKDKSLVLGCESPAHLAHIMGGKVAREPLDRLVCNALMASVARHPFWTHVHKRLHDERRRGDVLETTGPFFLTRAVRTFKEPDTLSIASHKLFYPIDKPELRGSEADISQALAVHHWRGTWWRGGSAMRWIKYAAGFARRVLRAGLTAMTELRMLVDATASRRYQREWTVRRSARLSGDSFEGGSVWVLLVGARRRMHAVVNVEDASPEQCVHCVMHASDFADADGLRDAVYDYRRQSGVRKRLTIIAPDGAPDGAHVGAEGDDETVVSDWLDVAPANELGDEPGDKPGDVVWARWGDYRSHSRRLATQLAVLNATGADACMLQRRLSVGSRCASLGRCGELRDTALARVAKPEMLWSAEELGPVDLTALIDEPMLSVKAAAVDLSGDDDEDGVREGDAYRRLVDALRLEYEGLNLNPSPMGPPIGAPPPVWGDVGLPTVLVLTPVKNAARHIMRYMANLKAIDYPPKKLSLAFLESDSNDGTWEQLNLVLPEMRERYARVELHRRDFRYRSERRRWDVREQRRRRETIALSRNLLLSLALRDEQWVLWMDADLLSWPPDSLKRLLATGGDVVAPHCIRENGMSFDLNTFKLSDDADKLDWSRYLYDGILQPPVGYGRTYLGAHRGLTELDGVGGTMLLVNADLHRKGLNFPPYAYRHLIETEGLAQMAKDMGHRCWGLPGLKVVHVSE